MARNRTKKKFIERLLFSQLFMTVLGLGILLLLSFPMAKIISQKHKIDSEIYALEKEIDAFQGKNDALKKTIEYMESEQFTEEQLRLKLGLKKPGEGVIAVKGDDGKDQRKDNGSNIEDNVFTIAGLGKNEKKKKTNPEKWLEYFLKKRKIN